MQSGTKTWSYVLDCSYPALFKLFVRSHTPDFVCMTGTLWFECQVHWRRHHQHAGFSTQQHFRGVLGKGFPEDSRHFNQYKLCLSPGQHIFVPIRSGIHKSLFSDRKKQLASQFNLTYRCIDDEFSINNPDFEHYLSQMYPADVEIKDTTESNTFASLLDLFMSIGRDDQFHTSFMKKVTNSTSISQRFRPRVAISYLCMHWRFYFMIHTIFRRYARDCSSYELFYSKGDTTFKWSYRTVICQGMFEIVI